MERILVEPQGSQYTTTMRRWLYSKLLKAGADANATVSYDRISLLTLTLSAVVSYYHVDGSPLFSLLRLL